MNIFLLDDTEIDYRMVVDMLQVLAPHAHQVTHARTYDEGLEIIQNKIFDVYMLDYVLSDTQERTGLDFSYKIREQDDSLPVIMFTGKGNPQVDLAAMGAGLMDYVDKGHMGPILLERSLRYAVERSRNYRELKQAAERISELEQLKTDIIRVAGHDLRNQATTILNSVDLLILTQPAAEADAVPNKYLERLKYAASRIARITTDILSLEKIEDDFQDYEEQTDMTELVGKLIVEYRLQAEMKSQTLEAHLADVILNVKGSASLLGTAARNLIENAIKYTPEAGHIIVSLTQMDKTVTFSVQDNGPGIPEKDHQMIFLPFKRLSHTTEEGTGLGLHLVQKVIGRYGGQLHFNSVVGQGSTFSFDLPLEL